MSERQRFSTGTKWEPVVGYSRAVRVGPFVAVSGTTAALPEGGAVGDDDVAEQTREAQQEKWIKKPHRLKGFRCWVLGVGY